MAINHLAIVVGTAFKVVVRSKALFIVRKLYFKLINLSLKIVDLRLHAVKFFQKIPIHDIEFFPVSELVLGKGKGFSDLSF